MSLRFRKSIKLGGGVKVNLSKSGIGYSIGTKGARITKTTNGRTRTTIGIPNTGISYVKESSNKKQHNKNDVNIDVNKNKTNEDGYKLLAWVCRICFIPMIFLGILCLLVEPILGLVTIGIGTLEYIYNKNYFKKI